jgi:hypothetical protein
LQQASKAIEDWVFLIRRRSDFHQTFGSYYRWKSDQMGNEKVDANEVKSLQAHQCAYRTTVFALSAAGTTGGHDAVQWGHQLVDFKETEGGGVELSFAVDGEVKNAKADLVVADGISTVRKILIGDDITPCVTSIVL